MATPGDGTVVIRWTAATGATSYNVYENGTVVASTSSTSTTRVGLVNGATYTYSVVGVNLGGTSAPSAAVTARPLPPLPAAPTGLTSASGNASVSLSWSAATSATGYTVYRNGTVVGTTTYTSYTVTGLTNGTTYSFDVVATNIAGASAHSSAVTAIPQSVGRAAASAGAASLGSTNYPIPTGALFVAPSRSDSNPGTLTAPVATIVKALSLAPTSGTVVLRGGVYHQSDINVTRTVTIQNYPGETVWLDGTTKVTSWVTDGSAWRSDGWNYVFDHSPTYTAGAPDGTTAGWQWINPAYPMAAYPDAVWINGSELTQVASQAAVVAGSFYVDTTNHRLYVGTNPVGQDVVSSNLQRAIYVSAPSTILRGFGVRRYATSVPQMGTVDVYGAGSTIENVVITDNATQGLHVRAANVTVNRDTVTGNGLDGLSINYSDGLRIIGLRSQFNTDQHFNRAPVSGGVKITRSRVVSISDSTISDNYGQGLWFDESVYAMTITGNDLRNNTGYGLVTELSDTGSVLNNVMADNGVDNFRVINTGNLQIWNNTFSHAAGRDLNIRQDSRDPNNLSTAGHDPRQSLPDPTMPWKSFHLVIRNNIYDNAAGNGLFGVEDSTHTYSAEQMDITTDYNEYVRASSSAPSWIVIWSAGTGNNLNPYVYTTLAAFRAAKYQDVHSVVSDNGAPLPTPTPLGLPSSVATLMGQPVGSSHMGAY